MSKILFFFTSEYPFGRGETFIENEISFLSNAFDKIVIVSNDCTEKQTRITPSNVTLFRFPYELNKNNTLLSILNIFNLLFWKEIRCIRKIYKKKISIVIVKTALISLQKVKIFRQFFSTLIKEQSNPNDSVIAYTYWANDTAFALSQLKKDFPNVKMVSRAHRWDIYFEENKSQYLPFRQPILEQLDSFFSISEHGKLYIESLFSKQFDALKISRLGVVKHSISPILNDTFIIVSVSNIIPVKNINTLVLALSLLDFDFKWYHIGDGELRRELEEMSLQLIPRKFAFLGQYSNNEVLHFLQQTPVSIFVNISLSEGIPVSIMEAISCGIPVIASNVGGNAEIVNNQNGLLLSSNPSPEDIAQAITSFKKLSESQKIQIRNNAYNTWEMNYNARANYAMFVREILSL